MYLSHLCTSSASWGVRTVQYTPGRSREWLCEMAQSTTTPRSSVTLSLEGQQSNKALPPSTQIPGDNMGRTKEEPSNGTNDCVTWNGPKDPENPFNWALLKKWRVTILACFMTFVVQINGTMMTSAAEQINHSFHVSDQDFPHSYWPVLSWNLGGAAAPLLGLPLMENFGVRWSYMVIYAVLILFIIPQALADNFATLVVTRIITGSCSGVLANITSGIVSDIWLGGRAKSFGTSLYIWCLLAGLSMGPVFGSLVVQYTTTWRWVFISQIIFYVALIPILLPSLPEVRPDVILTRRARKLRKLQDPNAPRVYAEAEKQHLRLRDILRETLIRPSHMLCTEGVVLAFGLWSAFCIGIAFMFTQSIVQVYSALYSWDFFATGLVQAAIVIGEVIGLVASLCQDHLYFASAKRNTEMPGRPIPEARLYLSIPASFIGLAGGFFYFAWTSYTDIPWIVPSIALAFVGFGMFTCTAAVTTYVLDAYAKYAASAIAGIAFLENLMAALLPLATQSMYRSLGFQWASSLLGFVALGLSCIPLVLLRYGRVIRGKSSFMREAAYEVE
ncbi:similar to MFS multidrug transporter [Plenodomus lingam JN3]|uniref:Similar to MFS multidrug transporter n=2 Tax=Leptosphaeria maculans TaxID=5022 RepID=E5A7I2_LEPMJ|nr:similar to MFS multidrug transporter [Plenodomus lingam JN3]CBX99577.1 similar to MFS multidrug transporter [Plenodomus lingam JN3]